jgi:tryptophan synthase beta chain
MRPLETMPDGRGHFGPYGGMFVPETLMTALEELTAEYESARVDPNFQWELDTLLHDFPGRPTPVCYAKRLTQKLAGAKIYLKREDLLHTDAHRINNALGRFCSHAGWVKVALSRRPALVSMASPHKDFAIASNPKSKT